MINISLTICVVLICVSTSEISNSWKDFLNPPGTYSTGFFKKDTTIQLQKLLKLQTTKDDLIRENHRYHLQVKKYKTLSYTMTILLFILAVFAIIGFIHFKRLKRENKLIAHDKDKFVQDQIKQYDQRILQMLIVKAGYEDMKDRLKEDFGLDDDDLTLQE